MMEKVLVTGGLGNLGSWISEKLHEMGFEVYVTVRRKRSFNHSCREIVCDITDSGSLKALAAVNFDYVVHLASYNEYFEPDYFPKALEINTGGTYNLLQAFRDSALKGFVYFSTVHVYGELKGKIDENTPVAPLNDYASTHLFAEYVTQQYCRSFQIPFTVLRLSNSYGCPVFPDNSKWYLALNDLCRQAVETGKIILQTNGQVSRDFVWMGDVAEITGKILSNKLFENSVWNLSFGSCIKIAELAEIVAGKVKSLTGKEIELKINEKDTRSYPGFSLSNELLVNKTAQVFQVKYEEEISKMVEKLSFPSQFE